MRPMPKPLDLRRLKVYPLAQRRSLSAIEEILINPAKAPPPCSREIESLIRDCAEKIRAARKRDASVILMYGAHLATNGAGSIHDWELSFLGRTEESVRENVATGTFGTWDETGRCAQLAVLAGALREEGYGQSLGRFVMEDGVALPTAGELEK